MVEQAQYPWENYIIYKIYHKKQKRYYACLVSKEHRKTTAYARYLMEVHLGRKLSKDETVDHINNNKTDDRIENFQILSVRENIRKSAKGETMVTLICPVCSKEFVQPRRQTHIIKGGNYTCCSRSCAGKYQHQVKGKFINGDATQLVENL
jgi:hypothetical protein